MSEKKERKEKDEKDEKEEEKNREKEEKWRRDRGNALVWAGVLIWIALVVIEATQGYAGLEDETWWETWAAAFVGVGAIVLLGTFARMLMPEYRRPVMGSLIMGFVFLGVGLGELTDEWELIGPIVLIGAALSIVFRAFVRRG
jgi:cation transport ATPase